MRIMQVNLWDDRGGAAQVASNLHRSYRTRGLVSRMAVGRKFGADPDVFVIQHEPYWPAPARLLRNVGRRLEAQSQRGPRIGLGRLGGLLISWTELSRRGAVRRGREDFCAPGAAHLLDAFPEPFDVLHLHNLHKDWQSTRQYFDLRTLPTFSARMPALITLHDAWLLSGHCAHSMDCERWLIGCGQCPYLDIYPAIRKDATAYNWQRKKKIFSHSRLHVATPSRWLMEKVERSMLAVGMASARVIPNGVDLTVFQPGSEDRHTLGLPTDALILLFATDGIRTNKMKDFETLRGAIAQVAGHRSKVVFVALGEAGGAEQVRQAEIRFVPYEKDIRRVAAYYRAADVYLHAARADTFPNSVIEALACGTPVIATRVGGIPEQVNEGRTGFLIDAGDATAMAEKIEILLRDAELRQRMGRAAALDAQARFDLNLQVDAYLAWYQEIQRSPDQERTILG